jgi:eukaryotic-like serine/threonine-protein kinase
MQSRLFGLLVLFCAVTTSSSAVPTDATFRGDAAHTGVYAAPGVPQFSKVKWQFHTNGQVLSSPAVTADTIYVGSSDHFLYALDRNSGSEKWKFKTEGRVTSSPSISNGLVYFASYDGNFYAVDAATGAQKWKFALPGERRFTATHIHGASPAAEAMPDPFDFYLSSAVVADGLVYFGSGDSNVYALDAATGKERWRFNNKGSWVIGSPAVRDDKVYFATSDTALLYALDAKTGVQIFSLSFKTWPLFSSPAIAADRLYIGSHEGKLFAIDLKSQKLAWTFATDGAKKNGPTYTKPDGTPNYDLAFSDFFYDDMVSGVQKMMSVGSVLSSPVIAGDTVYFGSTDGNIYALM